MKTQQPKIYGQSESSPKREIHSFTDLTQKTRKTSITQSKFTLKGNRGKKQQTKPKFSRRNEIIKIRAETNKIRS